MNLTQLGLFVQEKVILAVHQGLSLHESKKQEIRFGCRIKGFGIIVRKGYGSTLFNTGKKSYWQNQYGFTPTIKFNAITNASGINLGNTANAHDESFYEDIDLIIGLPPTLSRVLHTLGDDFRLNQDGEIETNTTHLYPWLKHEMICDRKLLNNDGTDATFRDQSDETKLAIAKLLGRTE